MQTGRDIELVTEETTTEQGKLGSVGALNFLIDRLEIDNILVLGGDNVFVTNVPVWLLTATVAESLRI